MPFCIFKLNLAVFKMKFSVAGSRLWAGGSEAMEIAAKNGAWTQIQAAAEGIVLGGRQKSTVHRDASSPPRLHFHGRCVGRGGEGDFGNLSPFGAAAGRERSRNRCSEGGERQSSGALACTVAHVSLFLLPNR